MKVIDLILGYNYNKKLPEKIKVNGMIFKYDGLLTYSHQDFDKKSYLFTDDYDWSAWLNNEIEVIEEDKKIEKVNTWVLCDSDFTSKGKYSLKATEIIDNAFEEYSRKINELIDEVNKLKEKE